MTDESTKPFGEKFRNPASTIDRTAELVGTPVAIIGGIAPVTQTKKVHAYSLTVTTRVVLQQLWDDEREIVELMARLRGLTPEQLTVQDVNLILAQARHTGELAERYEDEADAQSSRGS